MSPTVPISSLSHAPCDQPPTVADNESVQIWLDVFKYVNTAKDLGVYKRLKEEDVVTSKWTPNSNVFSSQLRFFGSMTMSAKLDHLIAQTKKAIKDNSCVVIALQSTGGAAAERSGKTDSIPSVAADILKELLLDSNIFCTQGIPTLQTLKDELDARIKVLEPRMPLNPLDVLLDELGGPDEVAEMTGRQHRYNNFDNILTRFFFARFRQRHYHHAVPYRVDYATLLDISR